MRKGRGLMGKYVGRKKRGSKEKETKRTYGVGRTLLSMLGQEDSTERVPAIAHDHL